jgi:FkbM family methyltransferase
MKTKIIRFLYKYRAWPQAFISKIFPKPVLLKLSGFKMYVRLDDWAVGARIAVNRVYEKHVTQEMLRWLKPGVVLVDIGANIGYYSLLAATHLGETGKIIAFEPSKESCNLLKMSVKRNGFKNVAIYAKAIADIDGMVGFHMDDSNGIINKELSGASAYQVEAVKLEHILRAESHIDLIKMDVEGAEGLVLRGAENLMRTHHPIVFTEFNPPSIASTSNMTADDFLNRFRSMGYELHVIDKDKGASQRPQSNQEILNCYEAVKPSHIDLLAIPQKPKPDLSDRIAY